MRWPALGFVVVSSGCLGPNPAFVGRSQVDADLETTGREGETSGSTRSAGADASTAAGGDGADESGGSDGGVPDTDPLDDVDGWRFDAPTRVPSLSSDVLDDDPTLRSDGLQVYFASARDGNERIYEASRASLDDVWGTPRVVLEFALNEDESVPRLSFDGRTMFFSSGRSDGELSLYQSTRATWSDAWSPPDPVDGLDDLAAQVHAGVMMPDGRTLYYDSEATGEFDLYVTVRADESGAFEAGVRLDGVSSSSEDTVPWVDPSGRLIVFASRRDTGDSNLWWAGHDGVEFSDPRPIDALNTTADEGDPWITDDLEWIYFSREESGVSSIYQARIVRE